MLVMLVNFQGIDSISIGNPSAEREKLKVRSILRMFELPSSHIEFQL